MAKKIDRVTKLIINHMKYGMSFESTGMWLNGKESLYSPGGKEVSNLEMQIMCHNHLAMTVKKIREAIKAESETTLRIN